MPMKRYKPEQIEALPRQIEVEIATGKAIPQAFKEAAISQQTYYRCRKESGGLKLDQVKQMKEPARENAKLKRLVAEFSPRRFIVEREIGKTAANPGVRYEARLVRSSGAFIE